MSASTATTVSAADSTGAPLSAVDAAPVLYFDGVCGLCNSTVQWLLKADRAGRFRFAPLQGTTAQALLPEEFRDLSSMVLTCDHRIYRKSAAVVGVLWRLGGMWKLLAALLWIIPAPIRNGGYSVIAKNRFRWFGKHETCRIPTPEEAARFLP